MPTMNRRAFLSAASAIAAAALLSKFDLAANAQAASTPRDNRPPNIIVILTDDVGIDQISAYGGRIPTPRIDELAKTGMRFEYCYATPLCGPSRFQLLTGCYPFRSGLNRNGIWPKKQISPEKQVMLSTVLKKAGYVTASVGKWGQMPLGPGEWGFDEHLKIAVSDRYWATKEDSTYQLNGKSVPIAEGEYVPDTAHKFLVDFITRHQNLPFFIYYPMLHMHAKLMRTPDTKPGATHPAELFEDNIAYMDKLVGQLAAHLDGLKLRDKTLIIFTGDNGSGSSAARIGDRTIIGHKGGMQEGGSRVPLIVNWPGTTPAGAVNHDLTDFSDFLPTLADLGSAKLPDGVNIDGQSFAAQIMGDRGQPRQWVRVELNGQSYVRDCRYKLTNEGEMFDLKDAPFEEIPIPRNSTDAEIIAARRRLQTIIDQHPTAPGRHTVGANAEE